MSFSRSARRATTAGVAALSLLALTACASTEAGESSPSASPRTSDDHDDHAHDGAQATEAAAATPRIVLTYDGGLVVLDANSLETEATLELPGFNRISPVGDGRHVAVSTTGGWAIVDAGTWTQAHGDHAHYFTAEPALHEVILEAEEPGHVVPHDGLTAFFDDGTGQVTVVETSEWADMVEHEHLHPIREYTTAEAHHGVAVATESGELLVTIGDADGRTGAMLLDEDDAVIASSEECPGVHGETAFTGASGEAYFVTGCEDGALVFHAEHVHKVAAPDAFGRIGNAFSVEGSDVVLTDYKTDPEGGIGLTQVTLLDVASESLTVIDAFPGADAQYTWRGLARGADGEALVLGTDGALRVLDPATGDVVRTIDVIDGWEIPEEWQTAHPALTVLAGMAYVTEPATGEVHIVDYAGGEVWKSVEVGVEMNEMVGVTG
jgi:hypothetical protein